MLEDVQHRRCQGSRPSIPIIFELDTHRESADATFFEPDTLIFETAVHQLYSSRQPSNYSTPSEPLTSEDRKPLVPSFEFNTSTDPATALQRRDPIHVGIQNLRLPHSWNPQHIANDPSLLPELVPASDHRACNLGYSLYRLKNQRNAFILEVHQR
jgi:hypothetical protein